MTVASFRLPTLLSLTLLFSAGLYAAPLVPGTGQKVPEVGDDFEAEPWDFVQNLPKSSEEQDKQKRLPTGKSTNGAGMKASSGGIRTS